MKKTIILAVMVIATGIIAGCSSLPERYNMTGTWKYTFEETGKSVVQDGSMTLAQESYKLKGKCSDAFGEFDLTGTITEQSTKFMIDGRRNDGKRNFHLTATMSSDNEFEGTYTTNQNTSGTMKGKRIGVAAY